MRLTKEKLLKTMNRIADNNTDEPIGTWTDDEKGDVFLESMHVMAVVPYNLDLMFAHDRATKWAGRIRCVITNNNWVNLGTTPSKPLNRKIRDAKPSPRTYPLMKIDDTLYDTEYIHQFVKHYTKGTDYVEFFAMMNKENNGPIIITTNEKEWMCVIAPRIPERSEDLADFETLYSSPAIISDAPTITTAEPKTFNPLTGVFE